MKRFKIHAVLLATLYCAPISCQPACAMPISLLPGIMHMNRQIYNLRMEGEAFVAYGIMQLEEDRRQAIEKYNEQQRQEFERRKKEVEEHNKKVDMYNEVLKIVQDVDALVGGKYYHINAYYRQAVDVFLKPNQDAYFAQSKETLETTLKTLKRIKSLLLSPEVKKQPLEKEYWNRRAQHFLALLKISDRYVHIAKLMLKALIDGTFSSETKKQARVMLADIEKGKLKGEALATALAQLVSEGLRTHGEHEELCARLEMLGELIFLSSRQGSKIVCTKDGICGVMPAVLAEVSGAPEFMVHMHNWLTGNDGMKTAQDVARIIKNKDGYIGDVYIGLEGDDYIGDTSIGKTGFVDQRIRVLDGGDDAASKLFRVFSRGNTVQKNTRKKTDTRESQKVVLTDKTTIVYRPETKEHEAEIVISNAPNWILPEAVYLRFTRKAEERHGPKTKTPKAYGADLHHLHDRLRREYEMLSDEERKQADEILKV